ncbi:MAG: HAMP domain-containing histidine kinase [Eubacterium sp.]|nr:HAMP domain-containing histidine kinase [Eubacterium sp.]
MALIFLGIILFLLIWTGILCARLACYHKQESHLLQELLLAEQEETNLLFTSAVNIGRTPALIDALNRVMEKNRHIKERLIRENRSYRESITSISHDIRTPLTSAKGYLQLICSDYGQVTAQKRQEYAKIVEQRLDALASLLDQLFLYTRIEAGELPLTVEKINAGNLFAETLSMFYNDFMDKGCEPHVQITKTPCQILADRQAFIRIVENLMKNALIHGTGDYEMSLLPDGACAAMRVANRTDSIEPSDIACIFDRFYTTDVSRSRKTTGLGLAIVKELAAQMGASASASLEGNLFTIELRFPLTPDSDAFAQ